MKKALFILIALILLTSTASAGYTLTVGPHEKYKTIQSAMYAADDGATIIVKSGIYKENVEITRDVFIQGKGNPIVYGFYSNSAGPLYLKGFKITKHGVRLKNIGDNVIINNIFSNCGISVTSVKCSYNAITENIFTNGGVTISTGSKGNEITRNTFYRSPVGLSVSKDSSCDVVTGNYFKKCTLALKFPISYKKVLIGNKYSGNKKNILYI